MCTPFDRLLRVMLGTRPREWGEGQTFQVLPAKDAHPLPSAANGPCGSTDTSLAMAFDDSHPDGHGSRIVDFDGRSVVSQISPLRVP